MSRTEDSVRRAERERLLATRLPAGPASEVVRDEIVSSWRRCQVVGVVPEGAEVPYRPEFERPQRLRRAADPVIDQLAEQLDDGTISILVADSDAQIVDRRAGGRDLSKALDAAYVAPGFLYAEEFTGTNGIGSALEERRPFIVSGSEHFRENLQEFTCIGSPLVHPISGTVEGVLDVTCRIGNTHEAIKPLVLSAAREIEARMYADASRREQMLLEQFLRARRRATTAAVLSLNEDVVMANTAASALVDVSDQEMLWEWACQMLGAQDEVVGEVRLARDVLVQARASRVGERGSMAGVLVEMRPRSRVTTRATVLPRPSTSLSPSSDEPPLKGRSVASARLREDVDTALAAAGPLLVCGEPGAGKRFVAAHLHRRRHGDTPLTELDARASHDTSDQWIEQLRDALAAEQTVILRRIDQLAPTLADAMERLLEEPTARWLIATSRARGGDDATARVLDHLPFSLTVPPLRYRTEDIADLATDLLVRHTTHRPVPRLQPGTLRTLRSLDWPGNVRELDGVLANAAARSLGCDITHEHLPPEYRSTSNRTEHRSLQRAERDIVLEALAETHGNKLAAAERLGIARSTLYRKMRILGIDENHLPMAPPQPCSDFGRFEGLPPP